MKTVFLFIIFCFPFILIGQSQIEIIGSLNASGISYRGTVYFFSEESNLTKLNYHFGINYYKKLSPDSSVKIGLGFSSMGYKTNFNPDLRYGPQQDGNIEIPILLTNGEYLNSTIFHNIHFLDIPIGFKYQPSQKKFKLFVETGFLPRLYLQTYDKIVTANNLQVQTYRDFEIKSIHLAVFMNLGFNYSINDQMHFTFQPNLKYHLSTTSKRSLLKEYERSVGVAMGLGINLN